MEPEDKFLLITRDLEEVVGENELLKILSERDLRIYLRTRTRRVKTQIRTSCLILKLNMLLHTVSRLKVAL